MKILISAIIIILTSFIICGAYFKINDNVPNETGSVEIDKNSELNGNIDSTVKRVDNRNNFYIVKNCVTKYYVSITDESIKNSSKENLSEYIYSLLDEKYIEYKNVTKENILENIKPISNVDIIINDMYVSQISFDISVYFAYGSISYYDGDFSIMVVLDRTNQTFKLFLEDYVKEKFSNLEENNQLEVNVEKMVKNDVNNIFDYRNISDDRYVRDLFMDIKYYIMHDNKKLYNILSEESKSKFESEKKFNDFITDFYNELISISLSNYNKVSENGRKVYYIKDSQNLFEFIVYESAPFKYKLSIIAIN